MSAGEQVLRFKYEKNAGYWLPVSATISRGGGAHEPIYAWSDHRVDAGVPDEVFATGAYGP